MRPKKQKSIEFENTCNCIVDLELLEKAMLWYSVSSLKSKRKIYLHGSYPAVSIYNEKIHIHRLLMMYMYKTKLPRHLYIHHIDSDKLNSEISNLEIIEDDKHGSHHNKGKILSKEHRFKISEANRKRKGIRRNPRRKEITPEIVYNMKNSGYSFNKISKILKLDWACVKIRYEDHIHDKNKQKQALIDMMRGDEELELYDDNPKNHGYER